jgi:phage tail sheath protein FI
VNIRRLFLYLEQSISQGIRFAVFEPNNTSLWSKLSRSISAFLKQAWTDGALFGATAKDAFYVRIDDVLNPPDQMALGILTIEIGVRPAYPAEFIIVRIGIWDGGTSMSEAS